MHYNIAYTTKDYAELTPTVTCIIALYDNEVTEFARVYNDGESEFFANGKTYSILDIDHVQIYDTSRTVPNTKASIEQSFKRAKDIRPIDSMERAADLFALQGTPVTNRFIRKPWKKKVMRPVVSYARMKSTSNELSKLHPTVVKTASKLYENKHYRQAILDTYIALVQAVKKKSGLTSDNTKLMQAVFSSQAPIIAVSDDSDEQLGFMWLFSGAVMGIRNPKAHALIEQNDPQRTLEWLSFASVLFRVLDDSSVTKKK